MLLLNSGAIFVGPLKSCIFWLDSLKVPSARDSTRRWTDLHFWDKIYKDWGDLLQVSSYIKSDRPAQIMLHITRIHINPNHPVVLLANNFFRRCALQNLEVNLQIWAKLPSRFFPNKNLSIWPCSQHVVANAPWAGDGRQKFDEGQVMLVFSVGWWIIRWWVGSDMSW